LTGTQRVMRVNWCRASCWRRAGQRTAMCGWAGDRTPTPPGRWDQLAMQAQNQTENEYSTQNLTVWFGHAMQGIVGASTPSESHEERVATRGLLRAYVRTIRVAGIGSKEKDAGERVRSLAHASAAAGRRQGPPGRLPSLSLHAPASAPCMERSSWANSAEFFSRRRQVRWGAK
jgi:hypothetical protein